MLSNLFGGKNASSAGVLDLSGVEEKEETTTTTTTAGGGGADETAQYANARNAIGDLLGSRLRTPGRTPPRQIAKVGPSAPDPSSEAGSSDDAVPLKEDPRFEKYFRMLKVGMPVPHVKHAMRRDGTNPDILDQDANKPFDCQNQAVSVAMRPRQPRQRKQKSGTRRARFRWNKLTDFITESVWGDLSDDETIKSFDIDEDEFNDLFKSEEDIPVRREPALLKKKKGRSAVRVIDPKRAANGGIVLALVKITLNQMTYFVNRMDPSNFTAGQIENMICYLPTEEEQAKLADYMLAVEEEEELLSRFNSMCECEKFMASLMTVKHPKEKLDAMHFKLEFQGCLDSIVQGEHQTTIRAIFSPNGTPWS